MTLCPLRSFLYLGRRETTSARPPEFTSKYVGVTWSKSNSNWRAQILIDSKNRYLGAFASEEEAARAFDTVAARWDKPVNFPRGGQVAAAKKDHPRIISLYRGVCWDVKTRKWVSRISLKSKRHILGYFVDEEDAAKRFDQVAAKHGRAVNFPSGEQVKAVKPVSCALPGESPTAVAHTESSSDRTTRKASKYRGVSWVSSRGKWAVRISFKSKRRTLGYFIDEEDAARKYDEAASEIGRAVNFHAKGRK